MKRSYDLISYNISGNGLSFIAVMLYIHYGVYPIKENDHIIGSTPCTLKEENDYMSTLSWNQGLAPTV